MASPVRVFLSYSHDSPEHQQWVLELANRLRDDGVDCWIDRFDSAPPDGWPRWMEQQLKQATFVVPVCSATYRQRFDGQQDPGNGLGVNWEADLIRQALYERRPGTQFVPILRDGESEDVVPESLRRFTRIRLPAQYDELYRILTDQSAAVPAPLGPIRPLPPVSSGVSLPSILPTIGAAKPPDMNAILRATKMPKPLDVNAILRAMKVPKPPDMNAILRAMEVPKPPDMKAILRALTAAVGKPFVASFEDSIRTIAHLAPQSPAVDDEKSTESSLMAWHSVRDAVFASWGDEFHDAKQLVEHEITSVEGFHVVTIAEQIDHLTEIMRDFGERTQSNDGGLSDRVITICANLAINILSSALYPYCGPFAFVLSAIFVLTYCLVSGKQRVAQTRRLLRQASLPLGDKRIVGHECDVFDGIKRGAKIISRLPRGTIVQVKDKVRGWMKVTFFDVLTSRQQIAWAKSKYLHRV